MSSRIVEIESVEYATDSVKVFVLKTDGRNCAWDAGAHIRVSVPEGGDRCYSLLALSGLTEFQWAIGVLREDCGAGGSLFMHSLNKGDALTVAGPFNNFPLHTGPAPATLFAGGIGITPIFSMAARLSARGSEFSLHYAGRTRNSLAFLPELESLCSHSLRIHCDNDESALEIGKALEASPPESFIYTCGPIGMIEAVQEKAIEFGWPTDRIKSELFENETTDEENEEFEVEILSTGQIVRVGKEQSIIDALEEAGMDPLYDCRRGDCGICQCGVVSGIPLHRDLILTDDEKASNKVMQICVSRSVTPRLVLDI
ncbi:MAG: PDR/VanB family oxidoreductase [Albidovulum sp.]|nr:PDR/VanB family oxidoreductase [Albidovulum sp.]MDE0306096.1 PDR/VanB family oxidoreductase [Albidovulum sp.]MDE0531805.1 PDR/VanB family oxidoreductase [Albidovulum sp.]